MLVTQSQLPSKQATNLFGRLYSAWLPRVIRLSLPLVVISKMKFNCALFPRSRLNPIFASTWYANNLLYHFSLSKIPNRIDIRMTAHPTRIFPISLCSVFFATLVDLYGELLSSHFTPSSSTVPPRLLLYSQVRIRDINRSLPFDLSYKRQVIPIYPLCARFQRIALKSFAQVLATRGSLFAVEFDRLQ